MKKTHKIIIICIVLILLCCGLVFLIPNLRTKICNIYICSKIEKNLEEKYEIDFEVNSKQLTTEDVIKQYAYSEYYHKFDECNAKYYFTAHYDEDKLDAYGDTYQPFITGLADENYKIISDTYTYYTFEDEIINLLTELVKKDYNSNNFVAVNAMRSEKVQTLSENATTFEDFCNNIQTYEPIFLFLDESSTDEELQDIYNTLYESKFPFSVYMIRVSSELIKAFKEDCVKNLYSYEQITAKIHNTLEYSYSLIFDEWQDHPDNVYLWHSAIDSENSNSDLIDSIIKDQTDN